MRFFRVIVSIAFALAISLAAAYAISIFMDLDGNAMEALTLPTFAPSKLFLKITLVVSFLLEVVCLAVSIYKRPIRKSIILWIIGLVCAVLACVTFFVWDMMLLTLAFLVILDVALCIANNFYIKYTKELYLATIPLTALALYLTAVCFAIVIINMP